MILHSDVTHRDHRQQNVPRGGSLEGSNGRVDEGIDRRGGEDEACSEEAHNLAGVSGCIPVTRGKRSTYGDMVGSLRVRCDCDGDADDAKEHEDERPPGEVGEAAVDG